MAKGGAKEDQGGPRRTKEGGEGGGFSVQHTSAEEVYYKKKGSGEISRWNT